MITPFTILLVCMILVLLYLPEIAEFMARQELAVLKEFRERHGKSDPSNR